MRGNSQCLFLFVVFYASLTICCAENFYDALGVKKDASNREIRRAFKKIALVHHPDKNPNDPTAHEKFVRFNYIYEVLTDEDLRRRYDQHGEEGLKDEQERGRKYESWSFYNTDFGLYDDDEDITTLSHGDFDDVTNLADTIVFVNFYSPRCSHCRDLAPVWRQLASRLKNVVTIAAVNCADSHRLCHKNSVHSFPTLILQPIGRRFEGSRTLEGLLSFVYSSLPNRVVNLRPSSWHRISQQAKDRPLLICLCDETYECLSEVNRKSLGFMLTNVASVVHLDCGTSQSSTDFCNKKFGSDHGTFMFPSPSDVNDISTAEKIDSLDVYEVFSLVQDILPEIQTVNDELATLLLSKPLKSAHLLFLYRNEFDEEVQMRMIRRHLQSSVSIVKADCTHRSELCSRIGNVAEPVALLIRASGAFEIFHGDLDILDITIFVQQALNSRLRALTDSTFPKSTNGWLIDFYAAWCPPCRQLLPVLRKVSANDRNGIKFGVIDCVQNEKICSQFNIQSYPTMIMFNRSREQRSSGYKSATKINEFIEDMLYPSVVTLTRENFYSSLTSRGDKMWIVEFYASWCGPCQQVAPIIRKLGRLTANDNIVVGQVDCQEESYICDRENVESYPYIRLYLPGSSEINNYREYSNWIQSANSIRAWALMQLPRASIELNSKTFAAIYKGGKPWLVDFYTNWCGHCRQFAPEYENVARRLKKLSISAKAGKLDCQQFGNECNRAGVSMYPSLMLYKGDGSKPIFIDSMDASSIINVVMSKLPQKSRSHEEL